MVAIELLDEGCGKTPIAEELRVAVAMGVIALQGVMVRGRGDGPRAR